MSPLSAMPFSGLVTPDFGSELTWLHAGMLALIVGLFAYVVRSLAPRQTPVWHLGWGSMALGLGCFGVSLWIRSTHAEYFALSNMYESLLVVGMWMIVGFLVMDRWFQRASLGWPVCLMILATVAYATTLPMEIKPLQAALQSYWRAIHVPVILSSYAMFTLAFVCSVIYLVKEYLGQGAVSPAIAGGAPRLDPNGGDVLTRNLDHVVVSHNLAEEMAIAHAAPTAQAMAAARASERRIDVYDEITYRCVAVGFPLLAIGIILGGLWANEAWGNYWSWDPKESMSLVTLLGYGVYLHMRVNGQHSARALAWVSVAGFLLMLVTYFGVNLMGVGLHSYGKIG